MDSHIEEAWERLIWRPTREGDAFESTVQRLAHAIKLQVVPPGGRLPSERALSARLQVSRGTLREAIKALAQVGMVESRAGRGGGTFVVAGFLADPEQLPGSRDAGDGRSPAEELRDVLAYRSVLEPGAAALAANRAIPAVERDHLVGALRASTEADAASRRFMDFRLHLSIASVGGSPSLTSAIASMQLRLEPLVNNIPTLDRNIAHSDQQHRQIVEAILSGSADKARAGMERHCAATAMLLEGLLPYGGSAAVTNAAQKPRH